MKTFDEAVKAAFFLQTPDRRTTSREDVRQQIESIGQSQLSFVQETLDNQIVIRMMEQASSETIAKVINCLTERLKTVGDCEDEGEDERKDDEAINECADSMMSIMLSAFTWGMTVGRKMEEQDIEKIVRVG